MKVNLLFIIILWASLDVLQGEKNLEIYVDQTLDEYSMLNKHVFSQLTFFSICTCNIHLKICNWWNNYSEI